MTESSGPADVKEREKQRAAEYAVARIEQDMVVGLGSGSTSAYAVKALGARVREGLRVVTVATSEETARLAQSLGIKLITDAVPLSVDMTIDGADEFDLQLRLIKGGGGDLTREKIVASATKREIIACDHAKKVDVLGAFPLAVEVIPMAGPLVAERIRRLGGQPVLRPAKRGVGPFLTDQNNHILDCHFGRITEPEALAAKLDGIAGLVEHGLFIGLASQVIMAVGEEIQVFDQPG